MKTLWLLFVIAFVAAASEAIAACQHGKVADCVVGGKPGKRFCIAGRWGPCIPTQRPTPPGTGTAPKVGPAALPVEVCGPRHKAGHLIEGVFGLDPECREINAFSNEFTCPTDDLDLPTDAEKILVLTPDDCGSLNGPLTWKKCIETHVPPHENGAPKPDITHFLVSPGDYSGWGPLVIDGLNGTPEQKRVIRYFGPALNTHPAIRAEMPFDLEAVVESMKFVGAHHWIVHGLTVRGGGLEQMSVGIVPSAVSTSSDIVLDQILIERTHENGVMIRSSADNCVQNSVIRDPVLGKDRIGVQIQTNLGNGAATGNRIVNNEIVNFGDAFQTAHAKNPFEISGHLDGTVVAENDMYVTQAHLDALDGVNDRCIENAVDLKIGSSNPNSPLRISNNRIWGYRKVPNCDGGGEAVVVHCSAMNVRIDHNIIFDQPWGIRTEGWAKNTSTSTCYRDSTNPTRNVIVEDNILYGIRAMAPNADNDRNGTLLTIATPGEKIRRNVFAHGDTLLVLNANAGLGQLEDNEAVELLAVPPGFIVGNQVFAASEAVDYTFWVKRWTSLSTVTLPRAYVRRPGLP